MLDRILVTPHDGVAVVQIDNPPVNALSREVRDSLESTIERLGGDPSTRAIVVMGAGRTFIAGADIKELEQTAWNPDAAPPDLHGLLERIEGLETPVVMAIHGTALGAGLELAMAAHYRVGLGDARLGLPEVNLGIIPGAEGTQRLTRLVGVEKALDMCLSGQPISGTDAARAGLLDRVVEGDLTAGAVAFARESIERGGPHPRTRDRSDRLGTPEANAPLFAAARNRARQTRRNKTAPLVAIEAIEAAATLPFDEGCRRERMLALQSLRSDQARALVHAFFAERNASKVPDVPPATPVAPINTVAIVGAGTMGGGIAMACANAGLRVTLIDVGQEALDRGLATIQRNYSSSVKRGRLTESAVAERFQRIEPRVGYEGIETADVVIEAVFENLALKKDVFAQLDRIARPDCVLATNTSTLDID